MHKNSYNRRWPTATVAARAATLPGPVPDAPGRRDRVCDPAPAQRRRPPSRRLPGSGALTRKPQGLPVTE